MTVPPRRPSSDHLPGSIAPRSTPASHHSPTSGSQAKDATPPSSGSAQSHEQRLSDGAPAMARESDLPHGPTDAKRKTILVVDDSATMRNVMSVYLMGSELNLVTAEDGERALRLLRLMKIDLVIADVNMPKMDGLTFAAEVRRGTVRGMANIPIVLVTGDHDPELESRAAGAGVDAFLRKPLDSTTIVATIERLLPETSEG